MLAKAPVGRAARASVPEAESADSGAAKKSVPATSGRPDLPAWKAERNAWHDMHKNVSTADWLAARASWISARDAFHASRAPVSSTSPLPTADPVVVPGEAFLPASTAA